MQMSGVPPGHICAVVEYAFVEAPAGDPFGGRGFWLGGVLDWGDIVKGDRGDQRLGIEARHIVKVGNVGRGCFEVVLREEGGTTTLLSWLSRQSMVKETNAHDGDAVQ